MTQPPTSRRYSHNRSHSATRSTRPAVPQYDRSVASSNSYRQSPKAAPPSPLGPSHRAQSFDQSVKSAPGATASSRRRSSSAQRYPPQHTNVPQHRRPQSSTSLSGISATRQSSAGTVYENSSIISAPSFSSHHSREIREPTNTRPASSKRVVRDQSPSNNRRSPSEKSIKAARVTRRLIEGTR